ncbi:hypothetical protein EDB19DRAFT_1979729 [Suillus lakei]|nr:hypothetical protein EDB19DRAFT_2001413 [Suillus lakei]KAG1739539.1 hypothetical protein EDB19DRAFT_1979729 [Suillus lakei]
MRTTFFAKPFPQVVYVVGFLSPLLLPPYSSQDSGPSCSYAATGQGLTKSELCLATYYPSTYVKAHMTSQTVADVFQLIVIPTFPVPPISPSDCLRDVRGNTAIPNHTMYGEWRKLCYCAGTPSRRLCWKSQKKTLRSAWMIAYFGNPTGINHGAEVMALQSGDVREGSVEIHTAIHQRGYPPAINNPVDNPSFLVLLC